MSTDVGVSPSGTDAEGRISVSKGFVQSDGNLSTRDSLTDETKSTSVAESDAIDEERCDKEQKHEVLGKNPPVRGKNDGEFDATVASTSIGIESYKEVGCWTLFARQVWAILSQIWLTKYRTPISTCMEFLTPVLMMLVLVAAYQLSLIAKMPAQTYDTVLINIPGPWVDLATQVAELRGIVGSPANRTRRLDFEEAFEHLNERLPGKAHGKGLDHVFSTSTCKKEKDLWFQDHEFVEKLQIWTQPMERVLNSFHGSSLYGNKHRRLQALGSDDNATIVGKKSSDPKVNDAYKLLNQANREFRRFLQNPLFVPTFSEYVALSKALSLLFNADSLPLLFTESSYGRQWGNLLTLGTLHLSPRDSPAVRAFQEYLNHTYPWAFRRVVRTRLHESEAEAVKYIDRTHNHERAWAVIDLSRFPISSPPQDFPQELRYKIRMNYTTLPNTKQITDYVTIGLNTRYQRYFLSGYLTLQRTLNEFALNISSANGDGQYCRPPEKEIWSMAMPTAAYEQNPFYLSVGYLLGLTIAMAYLYPTSRLIKAIVEEKELRIKETLLIMGLKPSAHWWGWFLTGLFTFGLIGILVTRLLAANVLIHSNAVYLFLWIFFFSTATMGFCLTVAALFSRARLAAIVGPIALFATLLPRFIFFGSNRNEAAVGKKWCSLLPASAFSFGADVVSDYEYSGQGVQSWNAGEGEYSFKTSVGFLFLDTILYVFLGWYLDRIMPREFGTPQHPLFLFSPPYWCGGRWSRNCGKKNQKVGLQDIGGDDVVESEDHESIDDPRLVPHIVARDLFKVYPRNKNRKDVPPAVDHLNLKLYESQITTLLGHNGAGKTTTISLLTGLYRPTSGDAFVYGKSIAHDVTAARRSIGLCPQQNVLFEKLTVKEHIFFFQRLKGLKPSMEKATELAKDIGLQEFFHITAAALSGGNKRKLCVATALCGNPKFLVLDEPTSGMDPAARRKTWDVLRKRREGRCILLCTHFMDEAEILSDRVAIMKGGKLRCSGSPLFLKQRFAIGYNFTAVLELHELQKKELEEDLEGQQEEQKLGLKIAAESLLTFVQSHIPEADIRRSGGKEITIRLPPNKEGTFPQLFDDLELQRRSLCLGAFAVENSSLEEVFIRLSDDTVVKNSDQPTDSAGFVGFNELIPKDRNSPAGFMSQIGLLFWKRVCIQRRDVKGFFYTVVVPVLLVSLVLLILTVKIQIVGPSIVISPNLYQVSNVREAAKVDVVVGGGATSGSDAIEETFDQLLGWSNESYGRLNFDRKTNETSSGSLSQFLLNSISKHDHNERYGAYSLNDTVRVNVVVNWSSVFRDAGNVFGFVKDAVNSEPLDGFKTTLEKIPGNYSLMFNSTLEQFLGRLGVLNSSLSLSFDETMTDGAMKAIFSQAGFNRKQFENDIAEILYKCLVAYGPSAPVNGTAIDIIKVIEDRWNVTEMKETLSALITNITNNWNATRFLESVVSVVNGKSRFSDLWNLTQFVDDAISYFQNTDGVVLNATGTPNDFSILLNRNTLSCVESNLGATSYRFNFNETQVVQEIGHVLASMISVNFGFEPSQLSEFFRRQVNFTISGNNPGLLLMVWGMTQVDDWLKEKGGWHLTWSVRDVINWLHVDSTEVQSFEMGIASTNFDSSSGVLSLSGMFIKAGSKILVEDATFNVTLGPQSLLNFSFPSEEVVYPYLVDTEVSILHNASSPHAIAAFNQHYMEFLFKRCTGKHDVRLVSVNHPLPLTTDQGLEVKTILSIFASMFILIPYCFIPGAFIAFLVQEKACKSKHLQLVSGTDLSAYWVSSYLYDICRFALLTFLIMMVFLMYGSDVAQVFVGSAEAFWCTSLLTLGYGLSILPFSYLIARRFDNHSSAQIAVIGVLFITGFGAVNAYYIMYSIDLTKDIATSLRPLFRLWPAYNVGDGLLAMSDAFWSKQVLGENVSPFDWDEAGKPLVLLYGLAIPYFLLLLLLEFSHDGGAGGMFGRLIRRASQEAEKSLLWCYGVKEQSGVLHLDDGLLDDHDGRDSDVLEEEVFVQEHSNELQKLSPVMFQDLWKVYLPSVGLFGSLIGSCSLFLNRLFCACRRTAADMELRRGYQPKRVVRGLTTAVRKGEVYGLLGANGAGKSTTLGMLTGDISPTSGKIFVAGYDATGKDDLNGVTKARRHIGFCPQVDPLLDLMTVRETLTLFGRLRGIGRLEVGEVVNRLMERLMLLDHSNKTCESLSGGNKRKLSLGIALIGDPRVLLIDEGSSGLDPLAKRNMWGLISNASKDRTVVLTTHSMEEAEALCTRACIMAKGQLLCLGSVQHLKTKYLDGYTIDVFCSVNSAEFQVDELVTEILDSVLPGSKLSERQGRFLRFDFTNASSVGLGNTFRNLERLKQTEGSIIDNYSICQCSLEQVFVQLSDRVSQNRGTGTGQSTDSSSDGGDVSTLGSA